MRYLRYVCILAVALTALAATTSPASAAAQKRVLITDWSGYAYNGGWFRVDLYCPGWNSNQVHHAWCWVCPQSSGRVQGWIDYNLPFFKTGCWAKVWPVSDPGNVKTQYFNTWGSGTLFFTFLP